MRENESSNSEELLPGSEPQQPLPTFPDADWPKILQRIMSYGSTDVQEDVLLLSALTTLGSSMERHVRCLYGGQYQYPCMQEFIIAPSTSGKRVLSYIRLLVEPIHDELRQQFLEKMKIYNQEKAAYDAMGEERAKKEVPQKPVNKMFLISDYGHWSDTLRKAFDHDRLSYNRRTNEEYREIKKMFLSLLISGTPGQVKALIPSAENGLFARQIFYYMHGIIEWMSQFDLCEEDLETIFAAIGLEWKKKLDMLKSHGIHTLRLTGEQKQEFDSVFSDLFFRSRLAKPLYCHAMHILSFIPSTEISHRTNVERDILFEKLGERFSRSQLKEQAEAMGIKENTAITWLKRLEQGGLIEKAEGRGNYARVRVCVCVCVCERECLNKVYPLYP